MSRVQDNTLERQNDAELNNLHGKIKSLRSVTIDILHDSQAQNQQLDRTANTFTQFTNSLVSTTRHQARTFSQQSPSRQIRTIAYVVGTLVFIWLFGGFIMRRVFGGGSSDGIDSVPPTDSLIADSGLAGEMRI